MAEEVNPYAQFVTPDALAPQGHEEPNPYAQFVQPDEAPKEAPAEGGGRPLSRTLGWGPDGLPIFEDEADNKQLQKSILDAHKSMLMGIAKGLHDIPMAVGQLGIHAAEKLLPEGSSAQKYAAGESRAMDRYISQGEKDYQEARPEEAKAAPDVGRFVGNAAGTAPIAAVVPGAGAAGLIPRTLAGGAGGAITGAITSPVEVNPDTDFFAEKGKQATAGAVGGTVAPAIMGALGRVISPNVRPEVRTLMEAGVRPTPGQIAGGMGNRLEEAATSIPVVGDFIGNARRRAVEDFNRGAVNHAMEPLGAQLAHDVPVGREAIGAMHDAIGQAYDQITPHLNVQIDPQFARDLNPVWTMRAGMSNPSQEAFDRIIDNEMARRFSPTGQASGQQYRDMESELGRQATDYLHSPAPSDREVGRALQQVQLRLRDLLERSNPAHAEELRGIHNAYAHALRVEGAAAKTGAEGGTFTPAQFSQSVRQLDPTLRKNAYARGDALMQEYSDAGRAVLGDRLPNSGTPYRGMAAAGAGLGALSLHNPMLAAGIAGGGAGVASAYSRPGVSALARLLASRPPEAQMIASGIRYPGNISLPAILAAQQVSAGNTP